MTTHQSNYFFSNSNERMRPLVVRCITLVDKYPIEIYLAVIIKHQSIEQKFYFIDKISHLIIRLICYIFFSRVQCWSRSIESLVRCILLHQLKFTDGIFVNTIQSFLDISAMDTLERDNDRHAAELASKVSRMKNVRYQHLFSCIFNHQHSCFRSPLISTMKQKNTIVFLILW